MQFQHTWQAVLAGTKTQTRRLVMPGEALVNSHGFKVEFHWNKIPNAVISAKVQTKWQVGRTYAVQPGRGQKAVVRVRITAIRRERLQDISEEDAIAEGCEAVYFSVSGTSGPHNPFPKPRMARDAYARLWDTIHIAPGTRWADNPDVWALSFCLVED